MLINVTSPVVSGDDPRDAQYDQNGFLRWYDEVFREGYKKDNEPVLLDDAVAHLESLGYELKVEHRYLVIRPGKLGIEIAKLVVSETTMAITNDEDLIEEIRSTVSGLVRKNSEFRGIYEYAGDDMNIGDLSGYEETICENSFNIISLKFEDVEIPVNWHYDTSLCNNIEEDDFESAS